MARHTFDTELQNLKVELVRMAGMVEEQINNSKEAFKRKNDKLAMDVIEKDRAVDDIEKSIESKCLSLLLKQQPVARDLRTVSTALKMVTDLERIGDQAADIADLVRHMDGEHIYSIVQHLPPMAELSVEMVHNSIMAFVSEDMELAKETIEQDDKVDELFDQVKNEVVEILKSDPDKMDSSINFLMIAKYLERIGDHAENICDWTEFSETGDYKNARIL
ncbi:MAG: phosphate signaling complex protein PhoU [Clostridiales bacterium]|nr:phosphate signaling complex protein PhoU [Clostridiales bacterium]